MQLTQRRQQDYWSPLSRMRDQLNRMFDYPAMAADDFFEGWSPSVDLREEKDAVLVRAEMPGLKKEDIDVSLHENNLVISGEKKCDEERKSDGGGAYRSECYYGRFFRSVALPYAVDAKKVKANYRDGVLTIELPRSEQSKPRQIEVNVQ
jgi:HSP20 family protein